MKSSRCGKRKSAASCAARESPPIKYRFAPDPEVVTPEQARAKVDQTVAAGADYIKLWVDSGFGTRAKLSPEFCAAVIDQARKHGKLTFGHAYELADAKMLVERGLNVLAHNVRDREVDGEFISLLKQRNVTLIPTLVRDELLFVYGDAPAWIDDPFFLKSVPPERLTVLKTKIREEQLKNPQRALIKAGFEMNKVNLKKLSDGGVRIAFGTDSGGAADRFFIQGFSEHREMELMVQSGLTPMQVIQSFSKSASETLGIDKEFGVAHQRQGRRPAGAGEKSARKHHAHADYSDDLSRREKIRVKELSRFIHLGSSNPSSTPSRTLSPSWTRSIPEQGNMRGGTSDS